jgi:hypothetical protein
MADSSTVASSADPIIYRESFDRVKGKIRAVPEVELQQINVDPLQAAALVLKAEPAVRAMRPRLLAAFTNFDVAAFDELPDYARALIHTATVFRSVAPEATGLAELQSEAAKQCDNVAADLNAAAQRGQINGSRLKELRPAMGYQNTAANLLLLAEIARANWSKLEGKTYLTQDELRQMEALAARLIDVSNQRERVPTILDEPGRDYQASFTLFYRTYTKVRRAIAFLLEEEGRGDDIDDILPSVFNGRAAGKKKQENANLVPVTTLPPHIAATAPASVPVRVGMPDSDPLTPQ